MSMIQVLAHQFPGERHAVNGDQIEIFRGVDLRENPNSMPSIADIAEWEANFDRASAWRDLQASARAALANSDVTAIRCFKSDVPFPPAWSSYCAALRLIVATEAGDPSAGLPARPAFPAGT